MSAQEIFNAEFFRAVSDVKTLPDNICEIVFSGRSNVGKSSVINALCAKKNLARVSKTPGRTRSVNVYETSRGRWLIDLPGYGFARVSPQEKEIWREMIGECIERRKKRKRVYVIIDAYVGPTELDFTMAGWLKDCGAPFKVVANKIDKLPAAISAEDIRKKTSELFGVNKDDVFPVSARKNQGFEFLRRDIISFFNAKN